MLKKKIPIGIENYKEIIDEKFYYVDKTLLAKELLDNRNKVFLITRPRRFGKTLGLSTIQTFFEDERDENGTKIDNLHYFDKKKIMTAGEPYTSHAGKYPLIKLSLKSAKQPDFETAYTNLKKEIAKEYRRHKYILKTDVLSKEESTEYCNIMEKKAEYQHYTTALEFLSDCLVRYHKNKCIILIDEYDVPLENAWFEGFYDPMIKFIRSLLESALKTNDHLMFSVITGCLRISRESIFTGLNNLKVVSILNTSFGEHFGFTLNEVEDMLDFYEIGEYKEATKTWYDGYLFGKTEVYNPWSVINYVDDTVSGTANFPKPYWSNTSSNNIIRELVERADVQVRREIESLLDGGVIEKPIHEDITYDMIFDSQDNLWNFLFFTGYLKKCEERQEGELQYLTMSIPNAEISYIYKNTILTWFDKKIRKTDMSPLIKAMEERDCEKFGNFLSEQLLETISFYDYKESYYHGFLTGILKCFPNYIVFSNQETGLGRSDILLQEAVFRGRGVILELKITDDINKMEEMCDKALQQIEEQQYEQILRKEGCKEILKYGLCFFKKGCLVKNLS